MKHWLRVQVILYALLLPVACALAQAPQPSYVPPEMSAVGMQAHYEHMAVIESNCNTIEEAIELRDQLTRNGALVSIISSPQRMLAWVPPESRQKVRSTVVNTFFGDVAVQSISYTAAEFVSNHGASSTLGVENEADQAIVEFLDFIKRPLTADEQRRIEERAQELEIKSTLVQPETCFSEISVDEPPQRDLHHGIPAIGGENQMLRRTRLYGYIVHSSFFLESKPGTGSWNWDPVVYDRYRNFYIVGMNYWVSFAARYGRTITTFWRLYSPYNSACQVNGEPVVVDEDSFVPQTIAKLATPTWYDSPPSWPTISAGPEWCWWYNNKVRASTGADDAICGFICYKPSGDEGVWPHAKVISWNNGDREGVYFTLDTQYWQAELDPFAAPMRNVIAHEIGHVWGAPDEYRNDNCNFDYRGIKNINCQTTHAAYGRPGYNMQGWDGIMVENYIQGNSIATPVHTGVIPVGQTAPTRLLTSTPSGITISIRNCDGIRTTSGVTPICIGVDFDYCHRLVVPVTVFKSGQTWYFDHWEVTREGGQVSNLDSYVNELPSFSYNSTFDNPAKDIRAVYTNSPPDIFTSNTTLSAHLAPANQSASPDPGIALKWRNRYNMSDVKTIVEYEASTGNWKELGYGHTTLGPFAVGIGQWTGVHIYSVPNSSGSGSTNIQANQTYRFRIVGEFNTVRGTVSPTATIKTRPSSPVDSVYCRDNNEPNSIGSPKTLTSSGPGMTPFKVDGAITIIPRSGEWSWFIPQGDYYRITVINVSNAMYGERLALTLRVKDNSKFKPKFRAQRAGTTTHINAVYSGGVYKLNLASDGEYLIKVESEISESISYDLVDRSGGHFGFGEYEINFERELVNPTILAPCTNCIKLVLTRPFPGEIIMKPHPPFRLFSTGFDKSSDSFFDVFYQIPPGYSFMGFGGDFGTLTENPTRLSITKNMREGQYEFYPIIEPISPSSAELVMIYPEGPMGPMEKRVSGAVGSTVQAEAKPPADYNFVGWGGDSTTTTNPLAVKLWRSKRLIAYWRPKPCQPEPMSEWRHQLLLRNARQSEVTLEYGMVPGAGDGLESGQVDLPPIPPPSAVDIRWINITGSQGSTTDHRAIKSSHVFQGRVQTGGTAPVRMTWAPPAASPNASYTLKVQGTPGSINMRTTSEYVFVDEGAYVYTIEVKEAGCPDPPNENEVTVTTVGVANNDWPCVELKLQIRNRQTGELWPYYNPYNLRILEKLGDGSVKPMMLREFTQLDSALIVRLCGDPDNNRPGREVIVVNENEDPDQKKDTITVPIPPPIPNGNGNPDRFVFKTSGEWELVSTPLLLKNPNTQILFNDPTMNLFAFNTATGAYESAESMEFGEGYWIKAGPFEQILVGLAQPSFDWNSLNGIGEPYGYGWNLIGSMSKPVPVAAIQQTPAGGMKAIFGWNPGSGYVVPTTIEPGKGFWVRVDPGTKLHMQISSVAGSGGTQYSTIVSRLDLAAFLTVEDGTGALRTIGVSGTPLNPEQRSILSLPVAPPQGVLDVRTGDGSMFLFEGENTVHVRAAGRVVISSPVAFNRAGIDVFDEDGRLLHSFGGDSGDQFLVDVHGERILRFVASVTPPHGGELTLGINYPNPFAQSSRTYIPYEVHTDGAVRLEVFDVLGRRVRTLVDGNMAAGAKLASWDGLDESGNSVPPGMYTYRLETQAGVRTRSMTIAK